MPTSSWDEKAYIGGSIKNMPKERIYTSLVDFSLVLYFAFRAFKMVVAGYVHYGDILNMKIVQ